MAVSFVQEVAKDATTGSTATPAATLSATPTAGNRLIARIAANQTVSSVTDSKGNAWTIDVAQATATPDWALVSCVPSTPLVSGDVVTAHLAGATSFHGIVIDEWANIGAFGASTALVGGVTTTRTTNSVTVPPGSLIFGVWTTTTLDSAFSPGSGYTAFNTANLTLSGGGLNLEGEYRVDPGTGGIYTPTATGSSTTQRGMSAYYTAKSAAASGKLKYAPPVQNSLTTVDLTSAPGDYFATWVAGADYVVNLSRTVVRTGLLEIDANGARSVKIIGGLWALNDGGTKNYHIHIHNLVGWAFIEGQEVDMANTHADFLVVSGGSLYTPDIYFQNSRIVNLTATDATNHADVFQPQGKVGRVYVDKLTFSSNYQGFTIASDGSTGSSPANAVTLSRVNSWFSSANATNPFTSHYWVNNADGVAGHDTAPFPLVFDDVWCDLTRGAGRAAYTNQISRVVYPSVFQTGSGQAGGGTLSTGGSSPFTAAEVIGASEAGDHSYTWFADSKAKAGGKLWNGSPSTGRSDVITDTDGSGSFVPPGIGVLYSTPGYLPRPSVGTSI